ncbi:alpha/beta hydrolase [Rhodobacteraceae bacterium RKSG542]|nr:alpha/beta hydrolase [Pseudovibrio flavus]
MPSQIEWVKVDRQHVDEARSFNEELMERFAALPDPWSFPLPVTRERRLQGLGAFPIPQYSQVAKDLEIDGSGGPLGLRLLRAPSGKPQGVLLYIHGGGFVYGSSSYQDPRLEEIARNTNMDVVSVDYRLAPEHPYPCAPDDCEAAALWLIGEGAERYGWEAFCIAGESAGANLAVVTMLRLRDKHSASPFCAAVLAAGFFDLNLTPSARNWGDKRLLLNTRDLDLFSRHYLLMGQDKQSPDASPLYADLSGLPCTLFSVGTQDPLIDDSLFMAARLRLAGGEVYVEIYEEGCHVFQSFDLALAKISRERIDTFLVNRVKKHA